MKALILIAVILTFTACFSAAGAHKQKSSRSGESSEEHFKLLKQLRPKLLRGYSPKVGRAPGRPCAHSGHDEPPRGHHSRPHPHPHPHRPQFPHGPSPRHTSLPENTLRPNSQAPSAPSSAPPTVIYTTTAATAAATTAAAVATTASPASAQNTAGVVSSTTTPSALQPENITTAPAESTALAESTTPAPETNTIDVNQQQELP